MLKYAFVTTIKILFVFNAFVLFCNHKSKFQYIESLIIYIVFIFKISLLFLNKKIDSKIYNDCKFLDRSYSNLYELASSLELRISELPMYTILIPLYKENYKTLYNLKYSIEKLNYPKEKLDILLLCEHDDINTIKVLNILQINSAKIVSVPKSTHKTKGNALNYGLNIARGKYLCIYDAEDIPGINQLLLSYYVFSKYGDKLSTIQYRLRYYNLHNTVNKICFLDYEYVFGYRNKIMSKFSNSFPLGGTSNHFVTKILKSAKGWRAENVTEDAELGCRLSTYGYNALMLDCPTLEESVNGVISFVKQRSRWIKGYIQTLFCNIEYLFQFKYYNNINRTIFCTMWFCISILLPFVFISNIVNVFIHYVTLTSMSSKVLFFEHNNLYDIWLYIGLDIVFRYILIRKANLKSNNILNITFQSVQFIILYFVSYLKAIFEIIFIPSYWDKTNHIGTYSVITK